MTTATRKPTVKRGYKIKVIRRQPIQPSIISPTIWSADVPTEWNEIHNDLSVNEAELYRSGRKVATFVRAASEKEVA